MAVEFGGSIVALVTPMTADNQIDTNAYTRLLEYHLELGTDGVVIGGTTGESPTLTATELETLVGIAIRTVRGRIPVIAGSGTNNTATSVRLTRRVCEAGADACLVVTPYYNKPTQEGLYRHYSAIADAARAPLILYNVPSRTACDLLPETVERLARDPWICAIKEATGDVARATEIRSRCGESFVVLSGDDSTALALMQAGAAGVVSVTANVAPRQMARLCAAAAGGDTEQAALIDERLRDLHQALFIESNPIPVKYAVSRLGLIGPALRLPLTPLAAANESAVVDAMKRAGLEIEAE